MSATEAQKKFYRTEKGKILKKKTDKNYRVKIRNKVMSILGNKCFKCGFSDTRALQVDHVNGGGHRDIKRNGQGGRFYNQVIKSFLNKENKYQLLCANCNWIKRVENNEIRNGHIIKK